jgi:hypothetical protein
MEKKTHDWIVRGIVLFVISACLIFAYWIMYSLRIDGVNCRYPIAWFVIVFAVLGAVVNESYREVEFPNPTIGQIGSYFLWKAAVAIVFAFVLYLMVVGGLIGGDLFPKFVVDTLDNNAHWNMKTFLIGVYPQDYKDIAKLLVWSFIAGYAEKFVPNAVGSIIETTAKDAKTNDNNLTPP